ncbi:MAG: hypothetical protein PF637_06010 [Spirochaetes bacterium]|jgi:hypothetical protein|nr:hypothetical protein [Spirochaetota bacterium]
MLGLDTLADLVNSVGFNNAVTLSTLTLLGFSLSMLSKRMNTLSGSINILAEKVSTPYLPAAESAWLFSSVLQNDMEDKTNFIAGVLRNNNLKVRGVQIRRNIATEFRSISNKNASMLSHYKSCSGDMGLIFRENLKWSELLEEVFAVVFSDQNDHSKLLDLRQLLKSHKEELVKIIEERGVAN